MKFYNNYHETCKLSLNVWLWNKSLLMGWNNPISKEKKDKREKNHISLISKNMGKNYNLNTSHWISTNGLIIYISTWCKKHHRTLFSQIYLINNWIIPLYNSINEVIKQERYDCMKRVADMRCRIVLWWKSTTKDFQNCYCS